MGDMYFIWENLNKNINVKQYVYYIGSYHYNWHDDLELLLVLHGEVELSMNGKNYLLKKDDLIVINPNVGHATLAGQLDTIAMVVHINPIYFKGYFKDYYSLQFNCVSNSSNRNDKCFREIRELLFTMLDVIIGYTHTPVEKIYYESLLSRLIANLVNNFFLKEIPSLEMVSNRKNTVTINKIINYIEKNYRNKITLEELSNFSGYHKSYISQIIKQQLGINYYEYLTRIRLREATYALANLKEKISDIALSYGFSDVKSFNMAFKSTFGKTPSEYRKILFLDKNISSNLRGKRYLTEEEFNKLKGISIDSGEGHNLISEYTGDKSDPVESKKVVDLGELKFAINELLKMVEHIDE